MKTMENSHVSKLCAFLAIPLIFFSSACGVKEEASPKVKKSHNGENAEQAEAPMQPENQDSGEIDEKDIPDIPIHPIQEEKNAIRTKAIKSYLAENFPGVSWYQLIENMQVTGEKLTIRNSDAIDVNARKGAASAVWEYVNSSASNFKLKTIVFQDKDGKMISFETNPQH
ncbi:hypothetical protein [Bacillus sp. T33-2]|uniref:hypothetical protein n=1 Tax=Bacillus sp. T33-2 TaxID=2054168 RepID=UPI000C78C1FC|nr:hypothetical protein [Bacillus sp. T33-2]PLR97564.1 hypothetical protein CVD19_08775 [Bacillus sp. T33-2]